LRIIWRTQPNVAVNPAHAVHVRKHAVKRGKPRPGSRTGSACHVFRATCITGPSSTVARSRMLKLWLRMNSPRMTKLYDRTGDQITLDEVEEIQI
jgi:hypothetical protein